jgi:hypothetical protein
MFEVNAIDDVGASFGTAPHRQSPSILRTDDSSR